MMPPFEMAKYLAHLDRLGRCPDTWVAGDQNSGALFSYAANDGEPLHRFLLWRVWNPRLPVLVWTGLNPSTATHNTNDATIRREIGWGKIWGYGGILKLNAYAYRTKSPAVMLERPDRIGVGNDNALRQVFYVARCQPQVTPLRVPGHLIVCWGGDIEHERERAVRDLLLQCGATAMCFGMTKANSNPRHPVRLPYSTPLGLWLAAP